MGLFDILSKKNSSKSAVNLDSESIKQKNRAQTIQYCDYIKSNFQRIYKLLSDLQNETKDLVNQIASTNGVKLSFREKGDLRKNKSKTYKNLKYLYLSRDFFIALSKNASGIVLQDKELALVCKFAPYFDGVPVLDTEEDDASVVSSIKEVGQSLMSVIGISKNKLNHYHFDDFLFCYEKKLDNLEMPDIDGAIQSFKTAISSLDLPSNSTEPKTSRCPCCGAKLNGFGVSGECEYCGSALN